MTHLDRVKKRIQADSVTSQDAFLRCIHKNILSQILLNLRTNNSLLDENSRNIDMLNANNNGLTYHNDQMR